MTTLTAPNLRLTPADRPGPVRCWGLSLDELHDRAWATHGIAVVRCRGGVVESQGPSYYLLLEPGQRVLFDPARLRAPTSWINPKLIRLRLIENVPAPYREIIESDDDDRFVRLRREYGERTRATVRAYLTSDARIAKAWAGSRGGLAGKRKIMGLAGTQATVAVALREGVHIGLPGDGPADVGSFLERLMARLNRLSMVVDSVYEFAPGVWAHENSHVDPNARIIPPVWIGAGATLDARDALVGPRIIDDAEAESPAISTVAWSDLIEPKWPMSMPSFGSQRRFRRFTKRAFDIVFALCMIALTLPIYPFVMLAIISEDGWPPFFAHRRQTRGGNEFPCFKFRTMRKDAEAIKARLLEENEVDGPQFFIKDDPRLLKCGATLRRFQIDELPQFINVLLGHMSVVGPRPSPDRENQYCPAWREARLSVRPGVTGLWQIRRTREPETDFQEWIRYDLEYVQHESWKLDLWIMTQTVKRVLMG